MPRALAILSLAAAAVSAARAALVEGDLLAKLQEFEAQKKQLNSQELALIQQAVASQNLRAVDLSKAVAVSAASGSTSGSSTSSGDDYEIATPAPMSATDSASFSSGETGTAAPNATEAATTAPTKTGAASVQVLAPTALAAAVVAWTLL